MDPGTRSSAQDKEELAPTQGLQIQFHAVLANRRQTEGIQIPLILHMGLSSCQLKRKCQERDAKPNLVVSSLLNELQVRCVHPGCYWTGRWDERPLHVSHCLGRELILMQDWKSELEHVRLMLMKKEKESRAMQQRIKQLTDSKNQLVEEAKVKQLQLNVKQSMLEFQQQEVEDLREQLSKVATVVAAACSVPTLVEECLDRTLEEASSVHKAIRLETQVAEPGGECLDSPSPAVAFLDLEAVEAVVVEASGLDRAVVWAKPTRVEAYLEEEALGKPKQLVVYSGNQADNRLKVAFLGRVQVEVCLDNPAPVAVSSDSLRVACLVVAVVELQLEPP
eukprot:Skav205720  [mRNA]  locus=scaffold1496:67073:73348:+ [translate_table: standard]